MSYVSGVSKKDAEDQFDTALAGYRRKDIEWFLSCPDAPAGPFLQTVCSTIDYLGGTVYGFRALRPNGSLIFNTGPRFVQTCEELMHTTPAEAQFLLKAVRNGIIHDGVPQMTASFTSATNPAPSTNFVSIGSDGRMVLYVGSLASQVLKAIDYVAMHRNMITDRPGEGDNKYNLARTINDAEDSEHALRAELSVNHRGSQDGLSNSVTTQSAHS